MQKQTFALAALALAALASPAQSSTLYGVDRLNNLVKFDSANPGVNLSVTAITGIGSARVVGLDLRVRNDTYYLLTDDKQLYSLNDVTGSATLRADLSAITGSNFAFDFNPTNANLRIVSDFNTNYVFNFTTNVLVPAPPVAYAIGDVSFATDPGITAAAYSFNDNDISTGTTLFVLDSKLDLLATQSPATGVLTTRGALGVDILGSASFEILAHDPTNAGFVQSGDRFYGINLSTGALSFVGNTDRELFALTTARGVPEPATWATMILGFGVVGAMSRSARRRRVAAAL